MDCTEFLNRYSEYDDSLIPPAEADGFRAHMAGCGSCARYDRVLRKGRMLARQLPEVEPSDDFVPRLHARLGQSPAPGPSGAGREHAPQVSASGRGRTLRLPAAGRGRLAARSPAAPRVDRDGRSSYSPLVTGPAALEGARPQPGASISAYRRLD